MLSRTGLYIIAIQVHRMSVAEAEEFYGPVRAILREKLKDITGQRARLRFWRRNSALDSIRRPRKPWAK